MEKLAPATGLAPTLYYYISAQKRPDCLINRRLGRPVQCFLLSQGSVISPLPVRDTEEDEKHRSSRVWDSGARTSGGGHVGVLRRGAALPDPWGQWALGS